ncbi:HFL101Cp [Eremothecium sinecaudum]|uniref:HFL101Cp n=1 Tax=Eremothecium sinecaudum TaxID=45286 RepID=A0A0X8HUQ3_9SACH|nr:HFL101Cp [Eremothecium sinecaudum]AMD21755.1 HFL101Cp [Eremothecium sinecaudum]
MSIATTPPITFTRTAAQLTGPSIEDTNKRTAPRTQLIPSSKTSFATPPLMVKSQMNRNINDTLEPTVARRVSLPSLNNLLSYSNTPFNERENLEKVSEGDSASAENSPGRAGTEWGHSATTGKRSFTKESDSKFTPRALPSVPRASNIVAVDPAYYDQRRESLEFLADTALNSSKSSSINNITPEGPNAKLSEEDSNTSNSNAQYLELIAQILALKNSMFQNLPSWPIGETGPIPLIKSVPKAELQQLLADARGLTSTTRDLLLLKLKYELHSGEREGSATETNIKAKEEGLPVTLPGVVELTSNSLSASENLSHTQLPNPLPRMTMQPPKSLAEYTFRRGSFNPGDRDWGSHAPGFRFPSASGSSYGSQSYEPMDRTVYPVSHNQHPLAQNEYRRRSISGPMRGGTYTVSLKPYHQQEQLRQHPGYGPLQHDNTMSQRTLPALRRNPEDPHLGLPPAPPTFHRLSMAQSNVPFSNSVSRPILPMQTHKHVLSEPSLSTMANAANSNTPAPLPPKTPNKRKRQRRSGSNSTAGGSGSNVGVCLHCQEKDTPEWRRGPYGNRTLCNACGLFYNKLIKKFGARDANIMMHYRRKILPDDRRVPDAVELPDSFVKMLDQRNDLDEQYAVIQSQ